ncbi:MAG: response regulator transcription factor [Acidobacteriaceae bacterium]
MGSVLIIDDDHNLCRSLSSYLAGHGFAVSAKQDMWSGIHAAGQEAFDLVILEIMLAGSEGLYPLRRLRKLSNIGIVVLSDRATVQDRIDAFEAGADDCLSKPCNSRELLVRIRAILRRMSLNKVHGLEGKLARIEELRLNSSTCQVQYTGNSLRLTETEFELLRALVNSAGTVMKREELAASIFRHELHPLDRRLDMHISRLRRKLDAIGYPAARIRTIRHSGYLFASASSNIEPNQFWSARQNLCQ